MDEIPNGERHSVDQRGKEAVVNVAWQTGGALGGAFDGPGYTPGRWSFGLSRPHSTAIWRVRLISFIVAVVFGVLAVASTVILGLTFGVIPVVVVAVAVVAAIAFITYCVTYPAERREILRRTAREYIEARTPPR